MKVVPCVNDIFLDPLQFLGKSCMVDLFLERLFRFLVPCPIVLFFIIRRRTGLNSTKCIFSSHHSFTNTKLRTRGLVLKTLHGTVRIADRKSRWAQMTNNVCAQCIKSSQTLTGFTWCWFRQKNTKARRPWSEHVLCSKISSMYTIQDNVLIWDTCTSIDVQEKMIFSFVCHLWCTPSTHIHLAVMKKDKSYQGYYTKTQHLSTCKVTFKFRKIVQLP